MSKIKKTPVGRSGTTTISEIDIKFEKTLQIAGWIFLFAFAGMMGIWGLFDYLLERINVVWDPVTLSFVIFNLTSSALCFGLTTSIKKNRDEKKSLFVYWLLGEFLFGMFCIFSVAVYQW